MRKLLAFLTLVRASCFGSVDTTWLNRAEKNIEVDTVSWLREGLKEALINMDASSKRPAVSLKKQCLTKNAVNAPDPQLIVFMSFSIPEATWMVLSRDINRLGGVFVLRGLPNNSFVEFATKLVAFKKNGLEAEVQINPILFEEYDIKRVPAFVLVDKNHFDKVTGNISVGYALELFEKQGETGNAKQLLEKWKMQGKHT